MSEVCAMTIQEAADQRYKRIHQLMEWRRYEEARKEAKALLQADPDDADGYAMLALVCLRLSEHDEALRWSSEALGRDPENKLGWHVRTSAYYETDKWKAMSESLEAAQRIDPYEPYYFFLKANSLNRIGRFAQAKEELLRGLELAPDNPLFLAALSYTEALLGHVVRSRELARQALEQEAENDTVYLYLGWAADQRNDFDEQLLMLSSAIRLDPNDKQVREQYLEALQKSYKFYRILLAPVNLLKRLKPWQILLSWFLAWVIFKPLVVVFIILYVLTHWATKLLVHVKVFGWRRSG